MRVRKVMNLCRKCLPMTDIATMLTVRVNERNESA